MDGFSILMGMYLTIGEDKFSPHKIAKIAGMSRNKAISICEKLKEAGFLEDEKRSYRITLQGEKACHAFYRASDDFYTELFTAWNRGKK